MLLNGAQQGFDLGLKDFQVVFVGYEQSGQKLDRLGRLDRSHRLSLSEACRRLSPGLKICQDALGVEKRNALGYT